MFIKLYDVNSNEFVVNITKIESIYIDEKGTTVETISGLHPVKHTPFEIVDIIEKTKTEQKTKENENLFNAMSKIYEEFSAKFIGGDLPKVEN